MVESKVDIRPKRLGPEVTSLSPRLDRKIIGNLAGAIGETSGGSPKEIEAELRSVGRLAQNVIEGRGTPEVYANLGKLTSEEQALAAVFYVQRIIGQDLGTKSKIYEFAQRAQWLAVMKSTYLFLLNRGRQRVGTEFERCGWVNSLAGALADGPSNESPNFIANVKWEPEEMIIDGKVVKVDKKKIFSGGGHSPEEWAALGYPLHVEVMPNVQVQNVLFEHPDLGGEATRIRERFKSWLGVRENPA